MLREAGLLWRADGSVVVAVVTDRATYRVLVPVQSVRFEIERAAKAEQLSLPDGIGDVDLVGWFGSKVWKKAKKAARGVARKVKKVAKRVTKRVRQVANTGVRLWKETSRYAGKVMQSREFGAVLAASAIACPAIGGPAFAAVQVANQARRALDAGGAAAQIAKQQVRHFASKPARSQREKLLSAALWSI